MTDETLRRRWNGWAATTRLALSGSVLALLSAFAILRWASLDAGTDALGRSDSEWLIAAAAMVPLTWVAGSCSQLGATVVHLPVRRVFAAQIAGSFVNHVVPGGFGLVALNLRMLRRCGLTRASATAAVGLNAAARFVLHALILVALILVVGQRTAGVDRATALLVTAGIVTAAGAVAVLTRRMTRKEGRRATQFRDTVALCRVVLKRPDRALLLWVGAAAIPVLHTLTLAAVIRGLGQSTPILSLAAAYLTATAFATALPSPGGFGSLDITLLAALSAIGLSASTAVASLIGYRLVTVWFPLIPGALTLHVLLRRRII